MSKHEVLTSVSNVGKMKKRLTAGDTLDSADVSKKDLVFLLARGAIAQAAASSKPAEPQVTASKESA